MGLWTTTNVFVAAGALRIAMLFYGLYQDANSPMKYTDIDYFVFTDAARYVSQGRSPYERETYRYTPLLAWLLLPTAMDGAMFSFGKVLFSIADMLAGWFLVQILQSTVNGMSRERALKYASIWLLNPMVAAISTRGSSEGLLGAMVTGILLAVVKKHVKLAGFLLGLAVHFKIYPFIYGPALVLFLMRPPPEMSNGSWIVDLIFRVLNDESVSLTSYALRTFIGLNVAMFSVYGGPFLEHTFFYHLSRIDHRHNFSPYNLLLIISSAPAEWSRWVSRYSFDFLAPERFAFIPQLGLSAVFIPLALSRRHLPSAMLAQTWAFVALNKVCTSQYFLWYLAILPLYLPYSSFLARPSLGITALGLWVAAQAFWLQQGYQLEFLGKNTFIPGLLTANLLFYAVNMWILGIIVTDVGNLDEGTLSYDRGPEEDTKKD